MQSNPQLMLTMAILCEVLATSLLKTTEGFTRLWPSLAVAVGYGLAIYLLSLALRGIPVGVAYAIWSGMGIVLVALAGALLYGQILDWPAVTGIVMVVAGVAVMQLFSKTLTT